MDGRGGGRGRGRGRARGQEGGRGHGRAPGQQGVQGRGRGFGDQELPQVFGAPVNIVGVPENLQNQSPEIDVLNGELSAKYSDIQNMRVAIAELREVVPNDKLSHEKCITVILDEYREMRSRCADVRNVIRRMEPPGIPFEEPEGFDIMP